MIHGKEPQELHEGIYASILEKNPVYKKNTRYTQHSTERQRTCTWNESIPSALKITSVQTEYKDIHQFSCYEEQFIYPGSYNTNNPTE